MVSGHNQKISCQQVLMDDSSVFSVQWMHLPVEFAGAMTPEVLLNRYLTYIRLSTFSLITPEKLNLGEGIGFLLFGSKKLPLISFLPVVKEGNELVIRICGGILVQRQQCHRGELRFGVEKEAEFVKISLQLSDYCPLILGSDKPSPLRRFLYRITQAAIHKLVTVRFLTLLYHELAGKKAPVKVVPVHIRSGIGL